MNNTTIRQLAMQFWTDLEQSKKVELFLEYERNNFTPAQGCNQLTGREIEGIFYQNIIIKWWKIYQETHKIYLVTSVEDIKEIYLRELLKNECWDCKGKIVDGICNCNRIFEQPKDLYINKGLDYEIDLEAPKSVETIKSVTRCPTCGVDCTIGVNGDNHYYIPKQKKVLREVAIDVSYELSKEREAEIDQLMKDNTIDVKEESLESKVRNLFSPIKNYISVSRILLSNSNDDEKVKLAQKEGLRADQNIYAIISEIHNASQPEIKKEVSTTIQSIYDMHRIKLDALKENRARWEEEKWTDAEADAVDKQIEILASVLSDLHRNILHNN